MGSIYEFLKGFYVQRRTNRLTGVYNVDMLSLQGKAHVFGLDRKSVGKNTLPMSSSPCGPLTYSVPGSRAGW